MNLDPAFAGMLAHIQEVTGGAKTYEGTPEEWRGRMSGAIEAGRDLTQFDGLFTCDDISVGSAAVRVYRPTEKTSDAIVIYLHPGGFAAGSVGLFEDVALRVLRETGACVVSVDYRLAPEHPFPAAHDDAVAAIEWVAQHAHELGGDPDRVAVVGESSGANLAVAATLALASRASRAVAPAALLLVTPVTDFTAVFPSQHEYGEGHFISDVDLQDIKAMYVGGADPSDPRLSPALSPDLARLPRTVVAVAGHDPLRDDGIAFVGALLRAGVEAELRSYPTLIHPFFGMPQVTPAADSAVRELCADLMAAVTRASEEHAS